MDLTTATIPPTAGRDPRPLPCPLSLRIEGIAAFLNVEVTDDPLCTGLELQLFDDPQHGTGAVVLLARRDDGRTDVHIQPGLRIDRDLLSIGAGPGAWIPTTFDRADLQVHEDGVVADLRFTDAHGRLIEVAVDDRDGRPRRRGRLLAPVGAGVEDPRSLMLVQVDAFDLVRVTDREPVIRFDGHPVTIGALPGRRVHGRHLIKYGTDLVVVQVNPDGRTEDHGPVETLTAHDGVHTARLALDPPLPALDALAPGQRLEGTWTVAVDHDPPLTGGRWGAARRGVRVDVGMVVSRRWQPRDLPLLMRIVTTVVPTFRRWPTTYRWAASVTPGVCPQDPATVRAGWHRTTSAARSAGPYARMTQRRTGRG